MRAVVVDFEEDEGRVVVVPVSLLLSVRTCALFVVDRVVVALVAVVRLVVLVALLSVAVADLSSVLELLLLLLADAAAAELDLRLASPRYTFVPVDLRCP